MNSHSGMKRKGDNIGRDCVLGLKERVDSLSLPGRELQQIVCCPVQRKAAPPDARNQPGLPIGATVRLRPSSHQG